MFSDEIINSDAFLDMPKGSQLLYFHLGIKADYDGFVANPKMVMRTIGASDDEYTVLLLKKFLLAFESGICVVKHWRINNYIRKDLYQETKYKKERSLLFIRPNGTYSFKQEGAKPLPNGYFTLEQLNSNVAVPVTCTPAYTERAQPVHLGKERIGKDSIDKSKDTNTTATAVVEGEPVTYTLDFEKFWLAFPKEGRKAKGTAFTSWQKKLKAYERAKCLPAIEAQVLANHFTNQDGKTFIPHASTWLNGKRWDDEISGTAPVQPKTIKI